MKSCCHFKIRWLVKEATRQKGVHLQPSHSAWREPPLFSFSYCSIQSPRSAIDTACKRRHWTKRTSGRCQRHFAIFQSSCQTCIWIYVSYWHCTLLHWIFLIHSFANNFQICCACNPFYQVLQHPALTVFAIPKWSHIFVHEWNPSADLHVSRLKLKLWGNDIWLFIIGLMCIGQASQSLCLPPFHMYFIVNQYQATCSFNFELCLCLQRLLCSPAVPDLPLWNPSLSLRCCNYILCKFPPVLSIFMPYCIFLTREFFDLFTCFSPLLFILWSTWQHCSFSFLSFKSLCICCPGKTLIFNGSWASDDNYTSLQVYLIKPS